MCLSDDIRSSHYIIHSTTEHSCYRELARHEQLRSYCLSHVLLFQFLGVLTILERTYWQSLQTRRLVRLLLPDLSILLVIELGSLRLRIYHLVYYFMVKVCNFAELFNQSVLGLVAGDTTFPLGLIIGNLTPLWVTTGSVMTATEGPL